MKYLSLIVVVILSIAVIHHTPAHASSNTYVALGDSVAAGAGLPSTDPLCKRSTQAYPYTVAQTTGLSLQSFACSGAKADEGVYDNQKVAKTTLPAQLDQAFSDGQPSLITITIGANDVRWTQFIRQCYYLRCGYKIDTTRFAAYLIDLKLELNIVMAKISRLSNGTPPTVILTGYYNPFSSTSCSATKELSLSEVSWLKNRTQSLNSAISGVVSKYSYARYAPVSFTGHELCSKEPWIQSPSNPMPFHPTAAGEEAIARAVLAKYTISSPSPAPRSSREKILDWYNRLRH